MRRSSDWRKRELESAWDIVRRLQPTRDAGSRVEHLDQPFNCCLAALDPDQLEWLKRELIFRQHAACSAFIGESCNGIKCVYSPSLADLCCDTFAAVAVDEGVKMKGEDTIIGLGLRQMRPRYRLVLKHLSPSAHGRECSVFPRNANLWPVRTTVEKLTPKLTPLS